MVAAIIQIWLKILQGLIEIQRFQVLETKCLLNLKLVHQLPGGDLRLISMKTVLDEYPNVLS